MKIVIVGHIDHGKSTLIGRLLFDTESIADDKIEDIKKKCKRLGKEFEFSFLLDALEEEQEQTITIDTTQIFFKSKKRNYFIIDAPGHKEFIKNMVTGASNAETAILLIDAKEGIMEQTNRHVYILKLLGIDKIIVALNKMDTIGFSEEGYNKLKEQAEVLLSRFDIEPVYILPISAKTGDNVTSKSSNMGWYSGPVLLEALDGFSVVSPSNLPLRFPVQDVYKWDERIIVGRVESGKFRTGERITFYPSLRSTIIKSIKKWNMQPAEATEGECIGITMGDQIFIERGEIGALESSPPKITQEFKANVFWMGQKPLEINKKYKLKLLTSESPCEILLIKKRIDSSTLEIIQENSSELENTEVGELVVRTDRPLAIDAFKDVKRPGRFVIIDDFDVAGGGIIIDTLESTDSAETS